MIWNALQLALREIRRNLMRSFLTILGIVIGVSAVITMVTLGNGATRAVSDQIASLGSNLLIVRPGQMLGPGRDSAGAPRFKVADADALRSQVSGLAAAVPVASKAVTLVAMARNWSSGVTGTTADWFTAGKWQLAAGRVFNPAEERAGAAVCVIGETIRRELFGGLDPIGQPLRVKQFSCEVIGLLASKGQSTMGSDQDDIVVVPLRTLQRRLTGSTDVATLMISVKDEASMDVAKNQVTWLMRERRHIAPGDDDNFSVMDTRQIAETLSGTTKVMTGLLGAVAAVSLLVGGIGIMNIMLVSVTERTREIGIRLAIGALEREVLLQFLIEAVVLSSLGGLIGIALATAASMAGAALMHVPYLFNPGINLLSFGFSAAIGVIFGYVPASRAARLDPIEALRHE
ncbi:ABC transporter permease [Zoogloea sp.]|uniref:ABC transporter permease n=1 Tax=Zoogloea sp. TaxID=49181 RepID=UPI0035B4414D